MIGQDLSQAVSALAKIRLVLVPDCKVIMIPKDIASRLRKTGNFDGKLLNRIGSNRCIADLSCWLQRFTDRLANLTPARTVEQKSGLELL